MVRFGHGYDQTPLQVFSGNRRSQRLSTKGGGILSKNYRAAPYVIPIRPGDTETVRNNLELQKAKGKRYIKQREQIGGGVRKKPRFYDLDYSYERIELRDRMLDMIPTPPPYSDTLFNYDIDANPTAPPPETSDYGHKDTIPTDQQTDPDDTPSPTTDPVPAPGEPEPTTEPEDIPPPQANIEDKKSTWEQVRDTYNDISITDDILVALLFKEPEKILTGIENSVKTVGHGIDIVVDQVIKKNKCIIM